MGKRKTKDLLNKTLLFYMRHLKVREKNRSPYRMIVKDVYRYIRILMMYKTLTTYIPRYIHLN